MGFKRNTGAPHRLAEQGRIFRDGEWVNDVMVHKNDVFNASEKTALRIAYKLESVEAGSLPADPEDPDGEAGPVPAPDEDETENPDEDETEDPDAGEDKSEGDADPDAGGSPYAGIDFASDDAYELARDYEVARDGLVDVEGHGENGALTVNDVKDVILAPYSGGGGWYTLPGGERLQGSRDVVFTRLSEIRAED